MASQLSCRQNSFYDYIEKTEPPVHPPLTMNNTVISVAQTHKHLGLTLSSSCTWPDHIGNICEQAWTRLNLMRALKFRVSRKSLEQNFNIHIIYTTPPGIL